MVLFSTGKPFFNPIAIPVDIVLPNDILHKVLLLGLKTLFVNKTTKRREKSQPTVQCFWILIGHNFFSSSKERFFVFFVGLCGDCISSNCSITD
jgi:hypothetical protein